MKKLLPVLVVLAVWASLAGCRVVPKTPAPPTVSSAVIGVVDDPVPPPKPASPAPATAVVAPTPLPPTKLAVAPKPAGAPLPKAMSSEEVMRNNIISVRSAVEQVRTDLGEDVEVVAAKVAALEKRVARVEGSVSAPAPAPAVAPIASPQAVVIDAKAWEGIIRSLFSARPTMAEIHLERLRQKFRGSDEELLAVLLSKTTDVGVADWLREQLGPKPAQ